MKDLLPRKSHVDLLFFFQLSHAERNCNHAVQIDETKILGKGFYGIVFAGTFDGKEVAMKRVPINESDDSEAKMFRREVEEHNRLDHDNVLKLLHVDEEKDPNLFK